MHGHQCVEGFQRIVILHVDPRFAGAARTLPDHVAAEIALADVLPVHEESGDAGQIERRIGHPVVEAIHQRPFGHDGQRGGIEPSGRESAIGIPVERGPRARERHQCIEAAAAGGGDRRSACSTRPPDVAEARIPRPAIDRNTDRVPGEAVTRSGPGFGESGLVPVRCRRHERRGVCLGWNRVVGRRFHPSSARSPARSQRTNQSEARAATCSSVPGSSNRWVAPGTMCSVLTHPSCV